MTNYISKGNRQIKTSNKQEYNSKAYLVSQQGR